MVTRSSKKLDLSQLAKAIVEEATGEKPKLEKLPQGKKADSRKGGLKGGKTRMDALSEEERKDLATKAAKARWEKTAPTGKAGAGDTTSNKQR